MRVLFVVALFITACSLETKVLGTSAGRDGSISPSDGQTRDARDRDAAMRDGGTTPDGRAPDGGVVDASCRVKAEICNGRDDDCNGAVDDGTCSDRTRRDLAGRGYLFCLAGTPWTGAESDCALRGYQLVVVSDAIEDRFVYDEMILLAPTSEIWIGLSDSNIEGTYLWVDGSVAWTGGAATGYANFRGGAPEDLDAEDCIHLDTESSLGLWADTDCARSLVYVCEPLWAITSSAPLGARSG